MLVSRARFKQRGKQTPPPGPRRPRTISPTPALPGAIGPKGARDRQPGVSGARESPVRPPSSRRSRPGAAARLPPAGPRPPPTYAGPPSVIVVEREGKLRPMLPAAPTAVVLPLPPPLGHFRNVVIQSWARAGVHVGCGTQASVRRRHVESGLPAWGEGEEGHTHAHAPIT